MYDELIAVHTIMRRGAELVAVSFARHADGGTVDVKALAGTARWLVEFVHHHHQSEDDLFWPVLRDLFPEAVAELDRLSAEHEALDVELSTLSAAIDADGAARPALLSAEKVRDILAAHLDEEEPVLAGLLPQVPSHDIVRLRKAIVRGAPRTGPHLVVGLMEYPDHAPGYAYMLSNFPPPVRWMRPLLLSRFRSTEKALGGAV
jgi:hemerythrin-like domain-containing protein